MIVPLPIDMMYVVRMNPPTLLDSKVREDTHDLLDELYKILHAMGLTSREKVE